MKADTKLSYQFTIWPADFNTACSSVSLHSQLKTRLALSLAVQAYSPTVTLHQPVKTGKRQEKWPNIPRHYMATKGCSWPPLTFQTVKILTAGFKSLLNGITK